MRHVASIAISASLACLAPLPAGADAPVEVFKIDFGPETVCSPGWSCVGSRSPDERFRWRGEGLGVRDRGVGRAPGDLGLVSGLRGEFLVGLDDGDYTIDLVLSDPLYPHGPFDVYAQGTLVVPSLRIIPGVRSVESFFVRVEGARLAIRFQPRSSGSNFVVNSMTIRGPVQSDSHNVYKDARPPANIPTVDEIEATEVPDARARLRQLCEWLLENRRPDGFLEVNSSEWYRASYPLRALLAGYEIFRDRRYLDAAIVVLDKLVDEQLPNSAWTSVYFGRPVRDRGAAEVNAAMQGTTNLADVGCIATCLSIASRYVDDARRAEYIAAHRAYADQYAAPRQLRSGAFPNALFGGVDQNVPYTVATGTQAMSFFALYAATEEEEYLRIGERAVDYLLEQWQADGSVLFHPHDIDLPSVFDSTRFGDLYYVDEALLWALHWTRSQLLRERIVSALDAHVKGPAGLLVRRQNEVWWPLTVPWTDSKSGGMPLALLAFGGELDIAVQRAVLFLRNQEIARSIGVATDPEAPWGEFAMTATGHAALSLAQSTNPGVIYLKGRSSRRRPAGAGARIESPGTIYLNRGTSRTPATAGETDSTIQAQ